MIVLSFVQFVITFISTLSLYMAVNTETSLSFAVGSVAIFFSVIAFRIGFGLIFKQKLVALAIGIIVIKYAILGLFIYALVKKSWFDPLWFCLGVASFTLAAVAFATVQAFKKGNNDVI